MDEQRLVARMVMEEPQVHVVSICTAVALALLVGDRLTAIKNLEVLRETLKDRTFVDGLNAFNLGAEKMAGDAGRTNFTGAWETIVIPKD